MQTDKEEITEKKLTAEEEAFSVEFPMRKNRKKGWIIALCSLLAAIVCFFSLGQLGIVVSRKRLGFWRPNYEKIDILPLLTQEELTQKEYDTLYRQTGLTKIGIEDMRYTAAGRRRIVTIQECLFKEYDIKSYSFGLFTCSEELGVGASNQHAAVSYLRDGDILVSSSMSVSWWRLGHAALVIDGENRQIIEAVEPGFPSETNVADSFDIRANFMVLRPKVDEEIKAKVVAYAQKELIGLRYDPTVGILSKKKAKNPKKSHCGHIVWRAYKEFGIDIDSNGGGAVTPKEIFNSKYMEVVQVFGFDLDTLWK